MTRLRKLLKEVRRDYPELTANPFKIRWGKLTDNSFAEITRKDPTLEHYVITIDKQFFKAPNDVLKGLLAHELGHALLHQRAKSKLVDTIDDLLYKFYPYYKLQEQQTDKLAVERGHGNNLIAFIIYTHPTPQEQHYNIGLSIQAIQHYMQRLAA